ncbi:MAG: MmgE/PrpD family protein [Rhodobacteraceae bacterium]|nr:MmgE/PrpD family protein [Paracoccaceae bacterium]
MALGPVTGSLAALIASLASYRVPVDVRDYARIVVFDTIGVLAAASHPSVTSASRIGVFAETHGGAGPATLVGRNRKVDVVSAVLANGTLGYAIDFEPHHPEAVLHPAAVVVPVALALSEAYRKSGTEMITAVILGCEVAYRVSMALDPRELYALGFHPSAVAGVFGASATSACLLELDKEACVRALGLAALQASGLLAWQDDPCEDARPFQMGMAARNGVTAALLAGQGFGAPDRVFDGGHTVLRAFSRSADPAPLTDQLGESWNGIIELAIKPYPCVSFLHPALDALEKLLAREQIHPDEIESMDLRFADSGAHCVDDNPLKGHCAQYILPVRAATGRLTFLDLFEDLRGSNPGVARLAAVTTVTRDRGDFDEIFPNFYACEVTLRLSDGRKLTERRDIARGYPQAPLSDEDITDKFRSVVSSVADTERVERLSNAAWDLGDAANVLSLTALLGKEPAA